MFSSSFSFWKMDKTTLVLLWQEWKRDSGNFSSNFDSNFSKASFLDDFCTCLIENRFKTFYSYPNEKFLYFFILVMSIEHGVFCEIKYYLIWIKTQAKSYVTSPKKSKINKKKFWKKEMFRNRSFTVCELSHEVNLKLIFQIWTILKSEKDFNLCHNCSLPWKTFLTIFSFDFESEQTLKEIWYLIQFVYFYLAELIIYSIVEFHSSNYLSVTCSKSTDITN